MVEVLDLLCFVWGSIFFILSVKSISYGRLNAYYIFTLVFFFFHFPSLIIDHLFSDQIVVFYESPNLFNALIDSDVAIIYDISICFIIFILYYNSLKDKNVIFLDIIKKIQYFQLGKITNMIFIFCMLLPALSILIAPDSSIYGIWAYPYRYSMSVEDDLFHETVMFTALNVSFFCMIFYALQNKKSDLLICLNILIITWLSFKRTFIVFSAIVLIFIEYLKGNFFLKAKQSIVKSIFLVLVCVYYFIYYTINTGKGTNVPFYYLYTLYYSRHYSLKVAIYDQLNGMSMLTYRGESFLFDLFFYIPRSIWNDKPSFFTQYFTNYCKDKDPESFSLVFYYVNIWSEFVANFHLFGIFIAFLFIKIIINISEKSNNKCAYVLAILFLTFYFFWGIQPQTMIIIALWFVTLFVGLIRRRINNI